MGACLRVTIVGKASICDRVGATGGTEGDNADSREGGEFSVAFNIARVEFNICSLRKKGRAEHVVKQD